MLLAIFFVIQLVASSKLSILSDAEKFGVFVWRKRGTHTFVKILISFSIKKYFPFIYSLDK